MLSGVWIPLITPFKDGQVDLASYRRLIEHYLARGVAGLVSARHHGRGSDPRRRRGGCDRRDDG